MNRVKNVDYDEDDLYSDEEDTYGDEDPAHSTQDQEQFATLTPVVRAELEEAGLQIPDKEIQDALWHYYWDVEKSVLYLKNTRAPKQQQDVKQEKGKAKPKSKFDEAAAKSAEIAGNAKSKQATPNGLAKKTEALKLEPTAPTQPKVKSKGLDVPKLWAEGKSTRKKSAAFVVIGHVDHGKSTLMGRLLLDTGAVAQRDVDKYKKQATELGKSSFALAWVMDTGSEERERGVTVDIAQHHFAIETADFTILDAPGHRDFVPNMIGGAAMADLAVLVVDANQLDSGLKGQTREHILLARAVGLTKVIVAVNKLDSTSPAWSEDAFQSVNAGVTKLLKEAGFAEDSIVMIPCSGLSGENVVKAPSKDTAGWVSKSHQTLLQALEGSVPAEAGVESVKHPLRLQVADVFRGGVTNPLSVSGRISVGVVQVGDAVMLQPSGETAAIKGIEVAGDGRDWAVAGQLCTLHLNDIDTQHIRTGDILCAADKPVTVVKSFTAKVRALESLLPQNVDVHFGRLHAPGSIAQLVATVDAKGDTLKKKPRMVKESQEALVKVRMNGSGIPVEGGDRVVLRAAGSTIAYGTVEFDG